MAPFLLPVNPSGGPAVSLLLGPSVTPLHMRGLGSFNPRIRLYRFRRSDHTLLGYEQYYFNLTAQSSNPSPTHEQWKFEYSSAQEYHLSDLSPTSLAGLLKSFENDTGKGDDTAWSRYWSHELGLREHDTKETGLCANPRDFLCRCEHLCAMRNLEISALDSCLDSCARLNPSSEANSLPGSAPDRSSIPIIVGVIVAFLVILVGVVIVVNREICRKRGHQNRRILGTNGPMGGVLFSAIDTNLPISFTHPRRENDHGDHSVNGTVVTVNPDEFVLSDRCTVFHPDMDNYSVVTVNTLDYNEKMLSRQLSLKGNRLEQVYSGRLGNARGPFPSLPNGAFLTPVGRPGNTPRSNSYSLPANPLPNNPRQVTPKLPGLRRPRSSRPQQLEQDHDQEQGSTTTGGDNSSLMTNGRPSLQRTIPAEDYYADDEEAFTDDEEDPVEKHFKSCSDQDRFFTLAHAPPSLASQVEVNGGQIDTGWTPSNASGRSSTSADRSLSPEQQLDEGFLLDNDRVPLAKRDKDHEANGSGNFIKRLSKSGFRLPPSFYTPQMMLSRLSRSGDPSTFNNHYEDIASDGTASVLQDSHHLQELGVNPSGLKHSQSVTFSASQQQENSPGPDVSSQSSRPASVASSLRSSAVVMQPDFQNGHGSSDLVATPKPLAVLPLYSDEEGGKKASDSATEMTLRGVASSGYDYIRI